MNPKWLKYLDVNAPRYTSFPSALFFDERVGADVYESALSRVSMYEPLSLYIHIPFCRQLCWYCGCNMVVENQYERAVRYVDLLIREIEMVADTLGGCGEVVSIHLGGGTPNYLNIEDLGRIFDSIELNLGLTDKANIAIEIDPRLCETGLIKMLTKIGINRLSIGVQDFDSSVQEAINREQPYELVEACVTEMRENAQADISFDLLYGLPRQSTEGFVDTLEKAVSLSPDRISLFGYAHLPSKLKHQRVIDETQLPGKLPRYQLAEMAGRYLVDEGYVCVGFDHFAKPSNSLAVAVHAGTLKRNFQGFTDDIANATIGLGVSSVSLVRGVYAQNIKRSDEYASRVSKGKLPTAKGWIKTMEDEFWAKVISDLLCYGKTDLHEHAHISGGSLSDLMAVSRKRIISLEKDGLAEWRDGIVIIPDQAKHFSRVVAAAFDPYINRGNFSLSQAV